MIIVTFFSIVFSTFVIDLTLPFNAGLAYFAVAKTYYGAQHATERGFERFWDTSRIDRADDAIIIVLHPARAGQRIVSTRIRRLLEREIGVDSVLHLNDFVDARESRARIWRELLHAVFPRYLKNADGAA